MMPHTTSDLANRHDDNGLGVPPGVYSITEAAAWLRISKRKLNEIALRFQFYAKNGNRKMFSQSDINKIWEAMQCHSTPTNHLGERTGTYEASTTLEEMFSGHSRRKTKPKQKH